LCEDHKVEDDVNENNGSPPMSLELNQLSESENEQEVDEDGEDQSCLGFSLELEFRVVIKLTKKIRTEKVFSEYFDNALFDVEGGLVTEYQRQRAERKLDEPSRPPWDVIFRVNEEISGLSLVA
jgi:hypothetical protein